MYSASRNGGFVKSSAYRNIIDGDPKPDRADYDSEKLKSLENVIPRSGTFDV